MSSVCTIGEAIDAGWRVFVACDCGQRDELANATLLWCKGRAMPLDVLPERLRCVRCGSRDVRVTWDVPSSPQPRTLEEAMAAPGRYVIEQLDVRGCVVERLQRDRFAQGEALLRDLARRKPGARFVMRDGSRVVGQWPRRGS